MKREWNFLLKESNSNSFFLRWEWLYNWWIIYGNKPNQLWIIIVKEGNTLIGIAPTYLKRTLGFNRIYFLGSNEVCSDYLDLIVRRGYEESAISSILSFFQQNQKLWNMACLADIPLTSKTTGLIHEIGENKQLNISEEPRYCYYISLHQNWDSIYEDFNSIIRNIIKKKIKRLEVIGEIKFIEANSYDDIKKLFPIFLTLNTKRLRMMNVTSPFLEPSFLAFHEAVINEFEDPEITRLFLLYIKDKPIAGLYIFNDNNTWFYYQSGFDTDWKQYSPGTLLMYHAIKCAFDRKAHEFDFLRGNEKYKSYWTKEKRINIKIKIYNNSLKGRLMKYTDQVIAKINKLIKRCKTIFSNQNTESN